MNITGIQGPGTLNAPPPDLLDPVPGGIVYLSTGNGSGGRIGLEATPLGYRIPGLPGVELELIEDEPPFYEATGPAVDALNLGRGLRVDRKPGRLAADLIRRHDHELAR